MLRRRPSRSCIIVSSPEFEDGFNENAEASGSSNNHVGALEFDGLVKTQNVFSP
ncbi:hypothetical protein Bca4012_057998 [Brassica carinata]